MNEGDERVLELTHVARTYMQGAQTLPVFEDISLNLNKGELVALVGSSGAGKSSLLYIAGLLEKPDSGEVSILGEATRGLGDQVLSYIRRERVGFVYQFHHLLDEFTALENVIIPQRLAGKNRQEARLKAADLLADMGLGERLDHRPAQLSGGEQQRVAIARALANDPVLLLADEPTGNLDHKTALLVFEQLLAQAREHGVATIIATHNLELAAHMDRTYTLHEGVLQESPVNC
ncbi:MAG: ABC transporter ATP-binding protein [Parvularculales bacterium]